MVLKRLKALFAAKEAITGIPLFFRAFRAWRKGDYPFFRKNDFTRCCGSRLYPFPVDLIPDVLIGPGWIDDAAVLAFLFRQIVKELADFEALEGWDNGR
ncbi:DUF1232 domain-containing protein [Bacillus sonorensis]|nr:DUF1232 domain-containing protein [Bacillus sonorensis]